VGRFIYATAVAVWLGMVVSFSFAFLPVIHNVLERGRARELLHRIFPRYYGIGLVCGLIAVASVSLSPDNPLFPFAERVRLAFPIVVSLLCTLSGYTVLFPRLSQMQQADEPGRYARLHQVSAMLNTTVLAMLILAMAATVTR
jgi:hypothetical protein